MEMLTEKPVSSKVPAGAPLLQVDDLAVVFETDQGVARAVDGVSFRLDAGETLALVGESGCGKSVTALALLRLIPSPPGRIVSGDIRFDGHALRDLPPTAMRRIRGNDISMIFQEPMTSMNPVFRIGAQISAVLRRTGAFPRRPPAVPLRNYYGAWAFRKRNGGWRNTRTRCRAACCSAS